MLPNEIERNQLAADTINGVYNCENDKNTPYASEAPDGVLIDDAFYEYLRVDFEGVIHGLVTDEIAELIENEYGIH